jgi:hypothetical protein
MGAQRHEQCSPGRTAFISGRIDKISVFGGLDQVLGGLVKLAPR